MIIKNTSVIADLESDSFLFDVGLPSNSDQVCAETDFKKAVADVYKLPYDKECPVVCMDESPKQLIEEKAFSKIKSDQDARVDYEYIRHGMVNIFMANELLTGNRFVEITEHKTKKDWARFIRRIAYEKYPKASV